LNADLVTAFVVLVSMLGLVLAFLIGIIVKQTRMETKIDNNLCKQIDYDSARITRLETMHDLPPIAFSFLRGKVIDGEIPEHP
jgi:hypothetical protein